MSKNTRKARRGGGFLTRLKERFNKARGLTKKRENNLSTKLGQATTNDNVKEALRAFKTQEGVSKESLYAAFQKAQKNPENFKEQIEEAIDYIEDMKKLNAENISKSMKEKAYRASLVLRHAAAVKAFMETAPVLAVTVPLDLFVPGQGKMPFSKAYFNVLGQLKGSTRRMLGLNKEQQNLRSLASRVKNATGASNTTRKRETYNSFSKPNNNNKSNKNA
ncbi:MAG: hypothetical protein EBV23_10645 [Flavobacteriia bacterium]|nr:hypothetical protein [Flavobacteriia bacterium]